MGAVDARRINRNSFIGLGSATRDNGIVGSDSIGTSSNDDMFAFSQVIADGGNVAATVKDLEEDEAKKKIIAKEKYNKSVWQYAVTSDVPKEKELTKEEQFKHRVALKELDELENNDATAAFAAL